LVSAAVREAAGIAGAGMTSYLRRVLLAASIVVITLALLTVTNYRYVLQTGGGNDFMVLWRAAHLWITNGISPYDPAVSTANQEAIYGRAANPLGGEDLAHFVYPLPAAMLLAPFGVLPLSVARAIWMTLLEISLLLLAAIGLALSGWRPGRPLVLFLAVFSVLWYHGLRAVILGQFAVLNAVFMLAALLAIQRGHDRAAGILLGFSILKPQMSVLLIPFVLFWAGWARRWQIVAWTLGSIGALMALSLLIMPDWPLQWLRNVSEYPQYNSVGAPLLILVEYLPSIPPFAGVAIGTVLLIYLLREWVVALGKPDTWFQWTAAMTIVVTHLIAFRTATTNYVNMLPALILVVGTVALSWGKNGERWMMLALSVVMVFHWALFLTSLLQPGSVESPIMYLPLPIIVLGGLIWSRSRRIQHDSARIP